MKKIIVANWKMQLGIKESLKLAKQYNQKIKSEKNTVVICPDYLALTLISPILKNGKLILGAQDCAVSSRGALTGEVSAADLKTLGTKYVILGHSERRDHLHENSAIINSKIKSALENKLIPILCVGEKLDEKRSGETKNYLLEQLRHALKGVKIKNACDLIIAYEPVWAISSNKSAKAMLPTEANEIHIFIKAQIKRILNIDINVLYGGSTKASNAHEFLSQSNIDGLLVGASSLNSSEFIKMTN